jgi:hypothetical protein
LLAVHCRGHTVASLYGCTARRVHLCRCIESSQQAGAPKMLEGGKNVKPRRKRARSAMMPSARNAGPQNTRIEVRRLRTHKCSRMLLSFGKRRCGTCAF